VSFLYLPCYLSFKHRETKESSLHHSRCLFVFVGLSLTSVSARDGQFEVLHSTFHLILYCTNQVDKLKIVFCFVFFLNKDIFQGRYSISLGLDTLSEMCNGPFFLRYRIVAVGNLISPNE
jgi:hypothetical protein